MQEVISALRELADTAWQYPGVKYIVGGVLLNAILAVAAAIKSDTFTFREVGTFLFKQLLPMVIVYAGSALVTEGSEWAWIPPAVLVAITAMLGARIVEHLRDLGVPIPDVVTNVTGEKRRFLIIHKVSDIKEEGASDDGRG